MFRGYLNLADLKRLLRTPRILPGGVRLGTVHAAPGHRRKPIGSSRRMQRKGGGYSVKLKAAYGVSSRAPAARETQGYKARISFKPPPPPAALGPHHLSGPPFA